MLLRRNTSWQEQPYTSGTCDTYHAEMGNPGYHFNYDQDGTLLEVRYLGTNVERQTNLDSITHEVLERLGKADAITSIPATDQHKYSYETGTYLELPMTPLKLIM